jgi:hypothetical protein
MPFNLERSTVNVKELIDKLYFDASKPFVFVINNIAYSYFEVISDSILLNKDINKIEIEGNLYELTEKDIIKFNGNNIDDILIPDNAHYYLIKIKIK